MVVNYKKQIKIVIQFCSVTSNVSVYFPYPIIIITFYLILSLYICIIICLVSKQTLPQFYVSLRVMKLYSTILKMVHNQCMFYYLMPRKHSIKLHLMFYSMNYVIVLCVIRLQSYYNTTCIQIKSVA